MQRGVKKRKRARERDSGDVRTFNLPDNISFDDRISEGGPLSRTGQNAHPMPWSFMR